MHTPNIDAPSSHIMRQIQILPLNHVCQIYLRFCSLPIYGSIFADTVNSDVNEPFISRPP